MGDKLDTNKFQTQFNTFIEATETARTASEQDRDYVNLQQWTSEETATLLSRGQAPVVFDYMREQLDYFLGVERDVRQDPKAYPRTKEHEDSASAITDALRYVVDNNDFDETASNQFEHMWVEGYAGAIIEPKKVGKGKKERFEVDISFIPWDRFYYDPSSRRRDFKDAMYMGIVTWLDESEAKQLYGKEAAEGIEARMDSTGGIDGHTFEDRPRWFDVKRKRVKVCQHYYKDNGDWHIVHFSGDLILIDSRPVPLKDENGEPECPIEVQSVYIDRENNRYGYARRLIDPQREINHRRSKALFLLSARNVIAEDGVVDSESAAKDELKKPDGWVTVTPGALSTGAIQVNQTGDMASGQVAMYQDAVEKINKSGANAAMQGDIDGMSGRAISRLQNGGSIQIGAIFDAHRSWKKRVYRQVWNRIRQFWDEERWVRVTDDEDNLKFVGFNVPITLGEKLKNEAKDGNQQAAELLQALTEAQDPRLNERVEVQNPIPEIDVDIMIDESADMVSSQEEQFKMLTDVLKIYGAQAAPFEAFVELSGIKGKRQFLDAIQGGDEQKAMQAQLAQQQQQLNEMMQQLQMRGLMADTAKKEADAQNAAAQAELNQSKTVHEQAKTAETIADTTQTQLENQNLAQFPDFTPNVNI